MKKQINWAILFITASALFVYAEAVRADGLFPEDALPTENALDAPLPPLLQAESLNPPPHDENPAEDEVIAPEQPDLWSIVSKGMILLKPEADGKIVASEDPKDLLGIHDIVYLHAAHEAFSPGEELVVYRINRPVFHPVSSSFMGDLVQVVGVVRVKTAGEDIATAEIILAKSSISRQDKIAFIDRFILPPAEREVFPEEGFEAMIIDATENHTSLAQHDIIYIDHGRDEGVSPGDQFVVIHGGQRQTAFSKSTSHQEGGGLRLPYREIGTMVVLSTQEHTSTAEITSSLESISKGDSILYINGE